MSNENGDFLSDDPIEHPFSDNVQTLNKIIVDEYKNEGERIARHFLDILVTELSLRDHSKLYIPIDGKRKLPGNFNYHIQGIDKRCSDFLYLESKYISSPYSMHSMSLVSQGKVELARFDWVISKEEPETVKLFNLSIGEGHNVLPVDLKISRDGQLTLIPHPLLPQETKKTLIASIYGHFNIEYDEGKVQEEFVEKGRRMTQTTMALLQSNPNYLIEWFSEGQWVSLTRRYPTVGDLQSFYRITAEVARRNNENTPVIVGVRKRKLKLNTGFDLASGTPFLIMSDGALDEVLVPCSVTSKNGDNQDTLMQITYDSTGPIAAYERNWSYVIRSAEIELFNNR